MKGFTLLEILIVAAMLAAVVLAVHSSFASVLVSLERGREMLEASQSARAVLWLMSGEFANSLHAEEAYFIGVKEGERAAVHFYATAVRPFNGQKDVFSVSYRAEDGNLIKTVDDKEFIAARGVAGLSFAYFDGEEWVKEWDSSASGKLPRAVKITLQTGEGDFSGRVSLPAGVMETRGLN